LKHDIDSEAEPLATRWRADAVLIAVTAVWGADFVLVKNLLRDTPPLSFLFWRFSLAAALIALVLPWRRRTPGLFADGLVMGLLLALGMGLQIVGQAETTASNASFLTGLASVLTPVAAFLRTRKFPTLENGLGILLAGAGFVLMTFPGRSGAINRGDIFVFGCGVVFAFYIVELAERSGRHDSAWFAGIQIAIVAVAAGAAALWLEGPARLASTVTPFVSEPELLVQALFLASVGTAGTFVFQTWAQNHMSATHAAVIFTLEPVFTAILAAWLLAERLGPRGWLGGVLVLAGIAVSELRLNRQSTVDSRE
jgi:drug/metabolite transporter (DMT)-like permease